jgi:hypothetical protein
MFSRGWSEKNNGVSAYPISQRQAAADEKEVGI